MSGRGRSGGVWLGTALLALLVVSGAAGRPLLTVSITSAPLDPSTSTDATFVFSADARGATFTCSLDEARATTCESPATYTGLSIGRHKFAVNAFRGREQARSTHTWNVVAPDPRKPWLTVVVDGEGTVRSSPAGISCPGDCLEQLAAGTRVQLSASPSGGHVLEGWGGHCTGTGSCTVTVGERTLAKATFAPAARPRPAAPSDPDRDRVPSGRDRCPGTARWSEPLLYGCSTADLVRDSAPLLTEVYDFPDAYATRVAGISQLRPVYRDLVRGIALVREGAGAVEQGDVCGGAATIGRGTRALDESAGRSARIVGRLQAAVMGEPAVAGDADGRDLRWAGLHLRQALVEELSEDAARARRAFAAACRGRGAKGVFVGRVTEIDDATGLLRLEGGSSFALPKGGYGGRRLAQGARARIVAGRFRGGPAIVHSAVGLDVAKLGEALSPCVSLRIAPPQDFTRPSPALYDPLGYYGYSGYYWLEEYVRWAATPECAAGKDARYSLHVVFEATDEPTKTIADLTAQDGAVARHLPAGPKTWTITVTQRRQGNSCPPSDEQAPPMPVVRSSDARPTAALSPGSATKSYPCPVVEIGKAVYRAKIRPAGSYVRATYERTVLSVNENGLDTTRVTALTGPDARIFPPSPTLRAEGYRPVGSDPPFAFKPVVGTQPFGVRPDHWYHPTPYLPLDFVLAIGVDHFAGLVWPRAVGTRNGKPYRYAVKLPTLVKDLLPTCPGDNCFHRLPWAAGSSEKTTQGNNGSASHYGLQQYAFDFVHEDGELIYATRGGIVGDLVEWRTKNCPRPSDCRGNYVRIDHQDGSYSFYAHLKPGSVVPFKGQRIPRGVPIAQVGETGRADGPHLHYQVTRDKSNEVYTQTIPTCFEAIWFHVETGDPFIDPCYVPVTGYFTQSTN